MSHLSSSPCYCCKIFSVTILLTCNTSSSKLQMAPHRGTVEYNMAAGQVQTTYLSRALEFTLVFLVFIFLVFYVVLLCVFMLLVLYCDVCYNFHINMMFSLSLPPVVCRRSQVWLSLVMSNFAVARLFSFLCCVFCFVCFRTLSCVSNVASFSLDCPFLIAQCCQFLSRLSIFDCPMLPVSL